MCLERIPKPSFKETRMGSYAKTKAWRTKNPDKVLEQGRRYRTRHPETGKRAKRKHRARHIEELRPIEAEQARNRRKADPAGYRRRMLAFRSRQRAEQDRIAGRPRPAICELCGEAAKTVFDHNHETGLFRGWLCDRCNRVLGSIKDRAELLQRMIEYLKSDGSLSWRS